MLLLDISALRLGRSLAVAALALVALSIDSLALAADEVRKGPAPGWVEPISVSIDAKVPESQVSDGAYWLLSDSQVRIRDSDAVQYFHYAVKAVAESGVESSANIEVNFDPSYQTLTLHAIRVHRAGRVFEKLASASIRVLQREKELEYLIFDGSKSASVFLDDVRVGDVVEYAYSLAGANPVFGNRNFGSRDLRFGVPVERLVSQLHVPSGRPMQVALRNSSLKLAMSESAGYRHYRLDLSKIPALMVDKDAPAWFDPWPALEWSEFTDWAAVARWADPLYAIQADPGPVVRAEIESIRRIGKDKAEQAAAVLRFVQREIRYLGVEIGPGSHAPRMPREVMERRFGDCKDKALLSIVMLDALGIRARPALVNTEADRAIANVTPNPGAFNHVIVLAEIGGKSYWLDPTRTTQKGPLASVFQPDFGLALVVDKDSKALTRMATATTSSQKKSIHAQFDSRDGIDKPVRYTVTTTSHGRSAEAARSSLLRSDREELQKTYLNFYASYYPGIVVAAPITVHDDESGNAITITEHYSISGFWPKGEAATRREADIYAAEMEELLEVPGTPIRQSPLNVIFPMQVVQTTEVLLPDDFAIKAETTRVEGPAFKFERVVTPGKRRIVLTDSYQTLADHVPSADVPRYAEQLKEAREALGYQLYIDDPSLAPARSTWENFNGMVALLGALMLAIIGWVALKLYRSDPAPSGLPPDPALSGLQGWLVLVGFGICASPLVSLYSFFEIAPAIALDSWTTLTSPSSDRYDPLWAPALLLQLAVMLATLAFSLLMIPLFFGKRRNLPRIYIATVSLELLGMSAVYALLWQIPSAAAEMGTDEWTEIAGLVFSALVWISYFRVSKRVKSTFVRGWREPPSLPRGPVPPLQAEPIRE